jgi:putative inorganic carbon (HCO3(-)) transporter
MGFALTVAYIVLTIISPEQFGPEWARYHALQYLAGITFVVSLPSILTEPYLKSSIQTFLLLGLFVAIALSEVANGWFGGVLVGWQAFLPSAAIFFFVVANVTTIRRLKFVTLAAIASCMVLVVEALCGYYGAYRGDMFVLHDHLYSHDEIVGDIFRLRGVGFLNDPNDFAQILLVALPLLWIFWQRQRVVYNSLLVLVPACVLLWAIYLTHSRGALMGLAVLTLMAARERLGATTSAVLTGGLVFAMLALDFTGGRGISASEGADRLEAWASGLEMFKSAPIFGVGFSNFADLNGITAHNSFVLCLAELGLLGSIIWVALLVTTTMSLNSIARSHKQWETMTGQHGETLPTAAEQGEEDMVSATASAHDSEFALEGEMTDPSAVEPRATGSTPLTVVEEPLPVTDLDRNGWAATTAATDMSMDVGNEIDASHQHIVPRQWVVVMRLALISFMATSWFLSRTYSSTMYLVLGLATSTVALDGADTGSHRSRPWLLFTLAIHAAMVLFIYAVVRLRY